MAKEYDALKVNMVDIKKKFDCMRTRYKNLEIECSGWRTKHLADADKLEQERELLRSLCVSIIFFYKLII